MSRKSKMMREGDFHAVKGKKEEPAAAESPTKENKKEKERDKDGVEEGEIKDKKEKRHRSSTGEGKERSRDSVSKERSVRDSESKERGRESHGRSERDSQSRDRGDMGPPRERATASTPRRSDYTDIFMLAQKCRNLHLYNILGLWIQITATATRRDDGRRGSRVRRSWTGWRRRRRPRGRRRGRRRRARRRKRQVQGRRRRRGYKQISFISKLACFLLMLNCQDRESEGSEGVVKKRREGEEREEKVN